MLATRRRSLHVAAAGMHRSLKHLHHLLDVITVHSTVFHCCHQNTISQTLANSSIQSLSPNTHVLDQPLTHSRTVRSPKRNFLVIQMHLLNVVAQLDVRGKSFCARLHDASMAMLRRWLERSHGRTARCRSSQQLLHAFMRRNSRNGKPDEQHEILLDRNAQARSRTEVHGRHSPDINAVAVDESLD